MKSELLEMRHKHFEEEETLRKNCKHLKKYIKIRKDSSCIGAGSCYPRVDVICRNCGTSKHIFNLDSKQQKTIKKTLKKQGFKDERLDGYVRYDWELE